MIKNTVETIFQLSPTTPQRNTIPNGTTTYGPFSLGDSYQLMGFTHCKQGLTLDIYQGADTDFAVKDSITVTADGAYTDGGGQKIAPITRVGPKCLIKITNAGAAMTTDFMILVQCRS